MFFYNPTTSSFLFIWTNFWVNTKYLSETEWQNFGHLDKCPDRRGQNSGHVINVIIYCNTGYKKARNNVVMKGTSIYKNIKNSTNSRKRGKDRNLNSKCANISATWYSTVFQFTNHNYFVPDNDYVIERFEKTFWSCMDVMQ